MTKEEWLNNNELSLTILNKKYINGDETFEQFLDRVSGGNNSIKELILKKKFIFGGRILASRGVTDRKVTYSNCYVITPPQDNIESIFECGKKLGRTYSYGGGCGIDLSELRPNGATVHNASKTSSGPISFMDMFSQITQTISQNGRRGALMLSMDVRHPDIEEFIDCKTDLNRVQFANISVRVTDDFMRAVENDTDYFLHWPCEMSISEQEMNTVQEYNTLVSVETSYGLVYLKKIKAKELYNKFVKNNWDYAEPGMLFWDRIEGYNMVSNDPDFKYAGTNPCLTGDSLIQTVEGEIPIKDLVGTTPYVYCMNNEGKLAIRKAIKVWKTRENANLVEVITGKGKLICTPDHRIYTTNRGWVEACNLQHGDKIKGLNRQTTGHKYCSVGLSGTQYEKEHRFIARHFYNIEDMDVHHINNNGFDNRLSNLEVITYEEHSRLSNNGRIIEYNRDKETGRYLSKEEHKTRDCKNLGKQVGNNWFVYEVRELDYTEDVYDMTVEDTHNFIANGFVVHNCAEEPLPAGGSCLLGSLNLSEFVLFPFTDKAQIDWDSLEEATRLAIRALNLVLVEGITLHPLEEQRESVFQWRQIGLGAMGLADCLIKLGIKYGSPESIQAINSIYRMIAVDSVLESLDMAKELGCYPACKKELLAESPFIKALELPTNCIDEIKQYGLYNSQLLTCAPTGSIGTMLEVSTGVEPQFALKYTRKTQSLEGKDTFFDVNAKIVDDFIKAHATETIEQLPDYFVTSADISPIDRVAVQSTLQRWIDASISSTINLPKEATVEQVKNIYMEAWKQGLKGVTIFRSGGKRDAVLTIEASKPEAIPMTSAPKRPKTLIADFHSIKVKGEQFIVLVGLLNGRPYEIFAFKPNMILNLPQHEGIITKKSKMHYSFASPMVEIKDLESLNEDIEERAATLYSSMLLRHGIAIKHIVKTAKKVNDNITSFSSAMCRVLSKYIPNEASGEKCPECGGNIINEGGCQHCESCGWSLCN